MTSRSRLRPPRQVAVTFAAVAVVSSTLLGLLSWQLVQQDRQLDEPRRRGLAEEAADSAAANLAALLDQIGAARDGATVITIEPDRTSIGPAGSVPFVPTRPQLPEADASALQAAAALEFAGRPDLPRVIAAYRALSASGPPQDRAAALARLAPLLARSGDTSGALRTYEQLGQLDNVAVAGLPASLVASVGRGALVAKSNQPADLKQAASTLARDLARGRWLLTRAEFDYYARRRPRRLAPDERPNRCRDWRTVVHRRPAAIGCSRGIRRRAHRSRRATRRRWFAERPGRRHARRLAGRPARHAHRVGGFLSSCPRRCHAGILQTEAFLRALQLLAARTGTLLNATTIGQQAGVKGQTVSGWLDVLQQNALALRLAPYHANLSKRVVRTPKLYFLDVGLAACLQGWRSVEPLLASPQAGPLFETLVLAELVRARVRTFARSGSSHRAAARPASHRRRYRFRFDSSRTG